MPIDDNDDMDHSVPKPWDKRPTEDMAAHPDEADMLDADDGDEDDGDEDDDGDDEDYDEDEDGDMLGDPVELTGRGGPFAADDT